MKPKIFFYTDARHAHIYRYEPPMSKEQYRAVIDELVETSVDAVVVCLGEGRTMLHDTRAGELLGAHIERWDHIVFRRAHQNAKALIEEGNDPLRLLCERAREKGLMIYPLLQVQKNGPESVPMRCSKFRVENRHLEIGAAGDVDAEYPGFDCLDFRHEEVRDERFGIIAEVVNGYDVDGFQLNLQEVPFFFHPDEIDPGRALLTAWVEKIHAEVKQSGAERELLIEIPFDLEEAHDAGLDVEGWITAGIVDALVPSGSGMGQMTDFSPVLAAAEGTPVRVLAPVGNGVGSDRLDTASTSAIRASACNFWEQGVDALYLTSWHGEWPYEARFYEKLRELPHPDIMAAKDKLYCIPIGGDGSTPLPQELAVGRRASVSFRIADDLARWAEFEQVYEVLLRVRLLNHTELDRLRFDLNGTELSENGHRRINEIYKQRVPHHRIMGGYWHVFRLGPEHWPVPGNNQLDVTLAQRDPVLDGDCRLHDVELEVRYLMGRNFHRGDGIGVGDVDPDLGPHD